jgi:hypothetical protein
MSELPVPAAEATEPGVADVVESDGYSILHHEADLTLLSFVHYVQIFRNITEDESGPCPKLPAMPD